MRVSSFAGVPALCALIATTGLGQSERAAKGVAAERLPGGVVDVSAGEFYLRSRDTIPAGMTTFRLRQMGDALTNPKKVEAENLAPPTADNDPTRAFHMLWVVLLDDGHTSTEWYDAKLKGEPTPWAVDMGGPAFAEPPGTSNATLLLKPGNYILVCHVGSAREDKNRHHLLKGMFRPLTVLPVKTAAVGMLQPDVIARITGMGKVQLSGPVRRGRQVIRVINETSKSHEFIVSEIKRGRNAAEAVSWRRTDGTTHPFDPRGGLSDVPAGATSTTTLVFGEGNFLFWTSRSPSTSIAVTVSAN